MEIIRYFCKNCNKKWSQNIEKCPFCYEIPVKTIGNNLKIVGITKVFLPSIGNEDIPYNVLLLMDEHGNKMPVKSLKDYNIGDVFEIH